MGDKPPSRRRYEEQNPTVSFRISKDKKAELDSIVEGLGVTKKEWLDGVIEEDGEKFSDIFQQGLSIGKDEGFDAGYEEGREEGREEAKQKFVARVPCTACGEPVPVDTDDRREMLYEFMEKLDIEWSAEPPPHTRDHGIQHETCPTE